jgi:DNA-binding transcriptional regulator/RsmH inhibitor MraZ
MHDDQFIKLFKYMQDEFAKIHAELADKASRSQVETVHRLLDDNLNKRERDEQERLAMSRQLDRHKDWITQLADKTKPSSHQSRSRRGIGSSPRCA